jgi:3-oxoacyl-[acyl-carrier protein] reductase
MMISLAGKAAVITGGSRGIGAAAVKLFAQAGADVIFSYHRSRDAAAQVVQEAGKHGTCVEFFKADLGRMKDAEQLIDHAATRLGRLDIVVANAGIWNVEDIPIEKLSERDWDDMLRTNLKSVYTVTHFAAAKMIAQRGGRIIAVSSTAGQRGEPFHAHYAASKGGIISFVKGLSTELARHNVLVNCVAPGWVDTEMSRPALETKAGAKLMMEQIPLKRVAKPEEIAGPILFMASDLATFITGEVLNVNGGAVLCG